MSSPPKERRVIKASVVLATEDLIKNLAAEHGCTQQELFGRVIDWFATQSRVRRAAILHGLSDEEIESYARDVKAAKPKKKRKS